MEEKLGEIMQHSLFAPMKDYLRREQNRVRKFLNQVETGDQEVWEILLLLNRYGAYGILTPLNELMRSILVGSSLRCWEDWMDQLPNQVLLEQISEQFHNGLKLFSKNDLWDGNVLSLLLTPHNVYGLVWNAILPQLPEILQLGGTSNLCSLLPGLHTTPLTSDYFEKLENYLFPALKKTVDCLDIAVIPNKKESDLVRYTVSFCVSELGYQYTNTMISMSRVILRYPWDRFFQMRYKEYQNILRQCTDLRQMDFYLTHTWVQQMEQLCQYADRFRIPAQSFTITLPVLLQCVGRNEDASSRLLVIFNSCDVHMRSDPTLLMGIYRALSVEKGEAQQKLYGYLLNTVSETPHIDMAANVVEDIEQFYIRFTVELQMRFDAHGIQKLLEAADESDSVFYYFYQALPSDKLARFYRNIVLLKDHIFSNNLITAEFRGLIQCIRSREEPYSIRLLAVAKAYHLFSCLAGRLYESAQQVRMYAHQTLAILGMTDIQTKEMQQCEAEVFNLYTPSQVQQLKNLEKRFHETMANLPNSASVMQYEHNKPASPLHLLEELEKIKELEFQTQSNSNQLQVLKNNQNAVPTILDILVRVMGGNDPKCNSIVTALADSPEDALLFSNGIHDLLKKRENMSPRFVALLEYLYERTEYIVRNESDLKNESRKKYSREIVDALIPLIPGMEQITSGMQLFKAIIKLGDTFDPDDQF